MTGALGKSNLWRDYEDALLAAAWAFKHGSIEGNEIGVCRARVAEAIRRMATR